PLVLDYRFLHRPRRRPFRNRPKLDVVAAVGAALGPAGRQALGIAPDLLSGFQERSAVAVLDGLAADHDQGVMISAGTGSGKTFAFYLPALAWIVDSIAADPGAWVRALAIYPRGELLKDQLRAVLQLTRALHAAGVPGRPVRVGAWFGPTPRSAHWLRNDWADTWRPRRQGTRVIAWECPFLPCLRCEEPLLWLASDVDAGVDRLVCSDPACGDEIDGRFLTLTRNGLSRKPADILFTTTESLNRQLAAPDQQAAFGISRRRVRMVLLDEVHTYEGASGAQNAYLLRRFRHAVAAPLLWVGLSATLRNAEQFFGEFVRLDGDRLTITQPTPDELEESGAEYLVALRHDPSSLTGPLSATIQTAMALTRCLDASPSLFRPPPPSSGGLVGKRTFVFTDKLDVTNRLYWDLLDAEGWYQRNKPKQRQVLTLAHLRASEQARRLPARQEAAEERDAAGQWWWLPEHLGQDLIGDEQLDVGRTSSQDTGVSEDADIIVATATLEVGYDDESLGAVIQHKAPHDAARFLQRKGRAGRSPIMRPWTVIVLSDWGRDRLAWQLYDQLFDPELEPRHLPVRNRYVLRMQATYATLDWLGGRLSGEGSNRSAWADLAGPAAVLEGAPERITARLDRQRMAADLIREVLIGGPAREHLRTHLRRALALDDQEEAELDALLWAPPRALLLAVLPTMHR
ncbi:MAG TPA: protein DpdJ, partial [Acidimicrobiia bacterium]|nr:protein DpdJ [Acidimicrobiia bacterium]